MAITVVTPPNNTKLATVADLKTLMDITVSTYDTLLGQLIDRATDAIKTFCRREFALQTISETLPGLNKQRMYLKRYPVVTLTSISLDGDLVDSDDYSLILPEAGVVFAKDHWEDTLGEFLYTAVYQFGYVLPSFSSGTINLPKNIEQAALLLAKSYFLTRQQDTGISSEEVPDVYKVTYGGRSKGDDAFMTPEIQSLLLPFRSFRA